MDVDRYRIIKKFGYKNGTFIQYLIDYSELATFDIMNNTGCATPDPNWIPEKRMKGPWCSPAQQDIYNSTQISIPLQRVICDKLKTLNILETKRKGCPVRNWYKLNLSIIRKAINEKEY